MNQSFFFWTPSQEIEEAISIELSDTLFHYIIRVRRFKQNDALILFDEKGICYEAQIKEVKRHSFTIFISKIYQAPAPNKKIILTQGYLQGEKMDLVIQKAVELGCSAIQPVESQYTAFHISQNNQAKKMNSWKKTIISAAEQSKNVHPPVLQSICTLKSTISHLKSDELNIMLHPYSSNSLLSYQDQIIKNKKINIFVGPEGGFSQEEVQWGIHHGLESANMGAHILRAETASLVVLGYIQILSQ